MVISKQFDIMIMANEQVLIKELETMKVVESE